MVFSSITFVYAFFPLVAVAYYLSKNRVYRNVVLLLASLLFYSWGEPRFLLLMLRNATFLFQFPQFCIHTVHLK